MVSDSYQAVSILVVNWNGRKLLSECLRGLAHQTYRNRPVILADNGSTDDSIELVRNLDPSIEIVALPINCGFSGGNIAALTRAKGPFVALVNNDVVLEPDWLDQLIKPMLADSTVGICASQIRFTSGGKINSAGDGITVAGVGFNRGLGADGAEFASPRAVFGACGAAVLYRRAMLDEIGFLDDDFFLYDEDTDLSFRAQLAGWKCLYVPSAVAHHVGNATAGRLSDAHVYYHTRNLEFVWLKNMPAALMLRYAHQKILQELGSFAYLCLRHGKWRPFFRAKRDALRMLPKMWRKRREIQKRRRVTDRYIREQLTSMFDLAMLRQKVQQFIRG